MVVMADRFGSSPNTQKKWCQKMRASAAALIRDARCRFDEETRRVGWRAVHLFQAS